MPSIWQTTPRAQDTQPLSVSMQLHPATDTDLGSSAAACVGDSNADAHAQHPLLAAQAARSHGQACCSDAESNTGRCNSLSLLRDGGQSGQMGLAERQIGLAERQVGLAERQRRSSNGHRCGQLEATNRSEIGNQSRRSNKRLPDRPQQCGFRGLDATDHCSNHDDASRVLHSDRLTGSAHAGRIARLDGGSLFANMQQTGHGQAYSSVPPLKVRSANAKSP